MSAEVHRKSIGIYWAFWGMFAVVFVLIAYKSFTVPITHDEGWTVIKYLDASPWEIMMYPDNWPNNHILNTLLAKAFASVFGVHDWSVRLPNLLFFWVFALGVFRFLKTIFQGRELWMLPAAAIFVLSPYFLDFFGLCRGYGISSALTMLSLSYMVTGYILQRTKHIWWAFVWALVASYANFTVLVYFSGATAMVGLYFLMYRKNWTDFLKKLGIQLVVLAGYAALIYTPIFKMKSTNQFEFWTSQGFYKETVESVMHLSLSDSGVYTRHEWFAVLVVVLTIVLWILGLRKVVSERSLKRAMAFPLVTVGAALLITISVNLIQTNVLGDPNLNGRTALFLLPIFTALVAIGLSLIPTGGKRWPSFVATVVLLLITIQHLGMSYRPNSFKEWRYDKHTFEVLELVKAENKKGTTIRVDWLHQNSFEFYQKYEHDSDWELLLYSDGATQNWPSEFYYTSKDSISVRGNDYRIVKSFEGDHVLLKRKE